MTTNTSRAAFSPKGIHTLIGTGMQIEGDIACPGVLRVQGSIRGNVNCDGNADGTVVLDSGASIAGTVSAPNLVISGNIAGPVNSTQHCEVHQSGIIAGDVTFRRMAIHGGVVEGHLSHRATEGAAEGGEGIRPPSAVASATVEPPRPRSAFRVVAFIAVAAAVAAGAWWSRHQPVGNGAATSDTAAPAPPAPAPVVAEPVRAPVAPVTAAPPTSPSPEADEARAENGVVSIRGINPSRPANVFLLVSHEASVLYRKKRNDVGDGSRVAVSQGEKVSVAIAKDELIRVAKGANIEIFYQGRKVPGEVIGDGSWIEFVPR